MKTTLSEYASRVADRIYDPILLQKIQNTVVDFGILAAITFIARNSLSASQFNINNPYVMAGTIAVLCWRSETIKNYVMKAVAVFAGFAASILTFKHGVGALASAFGALAGNGASSADPSDPVKPSKQDIVPVVADVQEEDVDLEAQNKNLKQAAVIPANQLVNQFVQQEEQGQALVDEFHQQVQKQAADDQEVDLNDFWTGVDERTEAEIQAVQQRDRLSLPIISTQVDSSIVLPRQLDQQQVFIAAWDQSPIGPVVFPAQSLQPSPLLPPVADQEQQQVNLSGNDADKLVAQFTEEQQREEVVISLSLATTVSADDDSENIPVDDEDPRDDADLSYEALYGKPIAFEQTAAATIAPTSAPVKEITAEEYEDLYGAGIELQSQPVVVKTETPPPTVNTVAVPVKKTAPLVETTPHKPIVSLGRIEKEKEIAFGRLLTTFSDLKTKMDSDRSQRTQENMTALEHLRKQIVALKDSLQPRARL